MDNNKSARIITSVRRYFLTAAMLAGMQLAAAGQANDWVRRDSTVWGIRNGMVVGLWPAAIENLKQGANGGPRGLFRIGYEYMGIVYHINYIAVEPVVNGRIEFSEISPSASDGKWGKLMWVSDTFNTADAVGMYVQIEKFANGAHPYLKLSISRNRPEELCIEVFHHPDSAPMERCGITATMGNYSRLRKLYLKDSVVNSRVLYAGYNGIGFIEKAPYSAGNIRVDQHGDFIVAATPDESFAELAAWPQQPAYWMRWNWRYRPFYMLTQYWRKEKNGADVTLQVRVNGRAKYWNGGGKDPKNYIDIPGGPSFENFELREKYVPGQRFYFGLTRKTAEELLSL
ncbi:hypothetical protein ACFOTA_20920 [Chitinophaga sp. GCM10012297]|uniref:DUF5077 domain-containing protein n=1 Tax=Chitinophaga chungangae TaxID=2821488 RepID=A0ABS3YKQ3_9BACT|nr:hypothetical protein [Chitinophaga chungangae]MBO9154689.1 hypothetical protein [Chitinophaga chungangae]